MLFDDGTNTLTFNPTSYSMEVIDSTVLHFNRVGTVISSGAPRNKPIKRKRSIELDLDDTDLATLALLFTEVQNKTFLFTDSNGRIWDASWINELGDSQPVYTADGMHRVQVELFLNSINSDAGVGAYANTDVSRLAITSTKTGSSALYFPLGYDYPLDIETVGTSKRIESEGTVFFHDRLTERERQVWKFSYLSEAFVTALEDYVMDDLKGATYDFSAVHPTQGTMSFRLVEGLKLNQSLNDTWSGGMKVLEEI